MITFAPPIQPPRGINTAPAIGIGGKPMINSASLFAIMFGCGIALAIIGPIAISYIRTRFPSQRAGSKIARILQIEALAIFTLSLSAFKLGVHSFLPTIGGIVAFVLLFGAVVGDITYRLRRNAPFS